MHTNKAVLSAREEYGFRGAVKTCVQQDTHPASTSCDGVTHPETATLYTTEFDTGGRILLRAVRNWDGSEWTTRHSYDASGRLLTTDTTSNKEGETRHETEYSYDARGRLLAISTGGNAANPVTFQYDESGRKTKIQTSRPEDYRRNIGINADSPFWAADLPPNLPGGGSATTSYDEQDRPVEVVVRDSAGEIVNRATRIYDAEGRITEERTSTENFVARIPPEDLEQMGKKSGASAAEFREQLAQVLRAKMKPHVVAFIYDSQGRCTEIRRQTFAHNDVKNITFNEHGDKALEVTQSTRYHDLEQNSPTTAEYSEVQYSYQYDVHGNWTEQKVSYRSTPNVDFVASTTYRRKLTYY